MIVFFWFCFLFVSGGDGKPHLNEVTSSAVSDFEIGGKVFEIGGGKKRRKQIRSAAEGYVVKDDVESGRANVIPLWAFGLNY